MREAKENYNKVHDEYLYTTSTLKMVEYEVGKFQNNNNEFEFRKGRTIGRRGGGSKWPIPFM